MREGRVTGWKVCSWVLGPQAGSAANACFLLLCPPVLGWPRASWDAQLVQHLGKQKSEWTCGQRGWLCCGFVCWTGIQEGTLPKGCQVSSLCAVLGAQVTVADFRFDFLANLDLRWDHKFSLCVFIISNCVVRFTLSNSAIHNIESVCL